MQKRDQWVLVIKKFNSVYNDHFSSDEAYKAVFTVGDLYEQLYNISRWEKDIDRALEYYQKTIKEYKPDRLTDDALYRQGEIFFNRGKYTDAVNSFQRISEILPNGDQLAKSKVRIANIRKLVHTQPTKKEGSAQLLNVSMPSKEKARTPFGRASTLKKINYTVGVDSVRVVVRISKSVAFSQGRLSKPERVYVNFDNTRLDGSVARDIKIGSRFLKGIRLSQFDQKNSRLVFD